VIEIEADGKSLAYRTAQISTHPFPIQHEPRPIYHSLGPFPALSPIPDSEVNITLQMENEAAYRQLLVQGVLAVLLPTEDLENDCLTSLVGQILSEMILGNGIGGKAAEPWLLWEGITKIAETIRAQLPKSKAQVRLERSNSDLGTRESVKLTRGSMTSWEFRRSLEKAFWLILQYGFLAFTAVRFFIVTIATASSLPSRISPTPRITSSGKGEGHTGNIEMTSAETISDGRTPTLKQPILQMKLWPCISNLVDLEYRMPWLSGTISMLQWGALTGPGEVGKTDGMVDK
jgi:hypothetical protein